MQIWSFVLEEIRETPMQLTQPEDTEKGVLLWAHSFIQMFVLCEDDARYGEIYKKLGIIPRKFQADGEDKYVVTPQSTDVINKSVNCCGTF